MNTLRTIAGAVCAGALLAACASSPMLAPVSSSSNASVASVEYGIIDAIEATQVARGTSGTGAVVGGLVGALAGNQVGSGTGRTAATVAGAVGGAVVGNKIESDRAQTQDMVQIRVRSDNGGYRTVVQESASGLRVGDRVRIVDGRLYRD